MSRTPLKKAAADCLTISASLSSCLHLYLHWDICAAQALGPVTSHDCIFHPQLLLNWGGGGAFFSASI